MKTHPTYLREWRSKTGLTQHQVVARLEGFEDPHIPRTTASLSRLENGKQPYSERVLNALADIYGCEPYELIGRNPEKGGEVIDLVARLDDRAREKAVGYIEGLIASN
jgi:transcriptional regulator with XRE-family HTH domain